MIGFFFMIAYIFLTKYYQCVYIKEDVVGGHTAGMGRREIPTEFCLGNLKKERHLKDRGLDGRIISTQIKKK
jgi:hypothetical protein